MTGALIVAALAILAALAFFFRKGGKDAVRADTAEKVVSDVQDAAEIRDRLHSDPAFRKRVRDRFTR